jgi:mono/diheme cytochrome c family protein
MMQAAVRVMLLAAVMSALPAWAQSEQQLIARGKSILSAKCGRCHQVNPTGRSPLAAAPTFSMVMQQYVPDDLEEALAEGLTTGHPAMPEFEFDPDEIAAILAYLGTLRQKR